MSPAYSLRVNLPRVTLAFLLAACGGKTESATGANGAGGFTTTGGVTSSGGACGFVMASCPSPDVSIGMNLCPTGRDCYLSTAGCSHVWCLRPSTINDAGNPLDASAPSGGAPATGGASGIGGSKPTTGGYSAIGGTSCPDLPSCRDDKDCSFGDYCGTQYCPPCRAICWMVCAPYQTSSCGAPNTALSDQISGDSCTVMVRVNAETLVVTDYAVNCGRVREVAASTLLNGLLQTNSIDWANAASITDPTKTSLFAYQVDDGSAQYTAYFSAETGNQLLVTKVDTSDAGTDYISYSIAWSPASDLGTTCAPGRLTFPSPFGMLDASSNLSAETASLVATDVFHIIRTTLGDVHFMAVTELLGTDPEYLFFITASMLFD